MPETMSIERRKLLVAYGAKLVLTEGPKGMNGAIAKAEEIAASDPERYVLLQQFKNPANPAIHETDDRARRSGTTPTARSTSSSPASAPAARSPASRATSSRRKGKPIVSVAVEPAASPVLTQKRAGEPLKPGPHKIQGIGAGFVPDVLDLSLVDAVEQVTNDEAIALRAPPGARGRHPLRHLVRRGGGRRGAPRASARRTPARPSSSILPDSGERYLSTILFEGVFDASGQAA